MKEEQAPRRESWLGNKGWLDQILQQVKYFSAKKPRKVTHWEVVPGLGTGCTGFLLFVNEQQSVTSGFPPPPIWCHFEAAQISVDFVSILVLSSLQPIPPIPCPVSLLQCCWCGPVWLSDNKTGPTLDAMRRCSNCPQLGCEIIWRRRWWRNYLKKLSANFISKYEIIWKWRWWIIIWSSSGFKPLLSTYM